MTVVNVYLNFNNSCEAAFNFYKSVFGGEFGYIGRYKDMPPGPDGKKCAPQDEQKVMHVSLPISKETMLMGSDAGGEWASNIVQGNNFCVSVSTDTKDEADRIFNGLSEGGKVLVPMNKTFWGDYFGMFTDKFGISWMMSFNEAMAQKNK